MVVVRCDNPRNLGRQFSLGAGRHLLGRERRAQVSLPAEQAVSREHAVLEVTEEGGVLRDLASLNGTRVNGSPVELASVGAGDRLELGRAVELLVVAVRRALARAPSARTVAHEQG